jgi:hypothetical protein
MTETKTERKQRLQAQGQWEEFVALRAQLTQGGMSPAEANGEALRRLEASAPNGPEPERTSPNGEASVPSQEPERVLAEESDGMLAAMRHVVRRPATADQTYEQAEYRSWLKQDRKGFLAKLADLERAEISKSPASTPTQPVAWSGPGKCPTCATEHFGRDEGSERVQRIIHQILQKAKAASEGSA